MRILVVDAYGKVGRRVIPTPHVGVSAIHVGVR